MWFIVMLLVVLMAGCNGNNASLGGGTAPIVNSTVPVAGATNVDATAPITATFSVPMDASTITTTTFTVTPATGTVALSADGLTATFTPDSDLTADTLYTATITTGAKSADGIAMAVNKVWTFTTGPAPTVIATSPANGSPVATVISATFSEPVSIAVATFTVTPAGGGPISGTMGLSGDILTVTFTPTTPLTAGTQYTATLTGVRDLAGNPMVTGATWIFTPI